MHPNKLLPLLIVMFTNGITLAQSPTGATSLGDLSGWPQARDGWPSELTAVGDRFFFAGRGDGAGNELWISDGTPGTQRLVRDINPGIDGSFPRHLTAIDGHVVFVTDARTNLWVSDGTQHGTRPVLEYEPDSSKQFDDLTVFDGYVYMRHREDKHGSEVWRYSVQDDEFVRITDIVEGPADSFPNNFHVAAGRLFFNSNVGMHVIEPRVEGARLVKPQGSGAIRITSTRPWVKYKRHYYFGASNSETGSELWRTDGTDEGTSQVVNLANGREGSFPDSLVVLGDLLYFIAQTPSFGRQLFVTNATPQGTALIRDGQRTDYRLSSLQAPADAEGHVAARRTQPGATVSTEPWPANVYRLVVFDEALYFSGERADGNWMLWRSDGTAAGSYALSVPDDMPDEFSFLLPFDLFGESFAQGYSHERGLELWRIVDNKSLEPLDEFHPGYPSGFGQLWRVHEKVYFSGSTPETGIELWEFDGSVDSRRLIANLMSDGTGDWQPTYFAEANGSVYFGGPGDKPKDAGIWRTNGTPESTIRLREFEAITDSNGDQQYVYVRQLISVGPKISFGIRAVYDPALHGEWIIDGDRIQKIDELRFANKMLFGDRFYGTIYGDLWSFGTTPGSSERIVQLFETYYSDLSRIDVSTDHFWLFSANQVDGKGLWKSDGTESGTTLSVPLTRCCDYERARSIGTIGNDFYFIHRDDDVRLWRAGDDGSVALSKLDNRLYDYRSLVYESTVFDEKIALLFHHSSGGKHLWITDGSPQGTENIGDVASGRHSVNSRIVVYKDQLYFTGYDEANGLALWRSDGTKRGTQPFHVFRDPPRQTWRPNLTVHKDDLYFVDKSPIGGGEIWKTDGTRVERVTNLMPGTLSAEPGNLKSLSGRLYFTAFISGQGRELMVLDE